MAITDGGPAFPQIRTEWTTDDFDRGFADTHSVGGMSLRDHFAGQALAGIPKVLQLGDHYVTETSVDAVADYAYRLADAMLKAREAQ